jgi:REP element-mobilizing transposase RayT
MARPLRIEYPGALYHVTARGDRQEAIYLSDKDRFAFLEILSHAVETFNWLVHAYCLMDNHYHLLVETPDGNLSQGMRQLNGVYTQTHNRNNHRVGHVFQGRYRAILVQKESYLLELARYIVLNPVRARMVRTAKDWPWSSYLETAGEREPLGWLHTDWLLAAFGRRLSSARKKYRQFVADGKNQPSPWESLRNQVFLGSEEFVDELRKKIQKDRDLSEIPRSQRRGKPRSLAHYAKSADSRDESIVAAYASGGYSMKQIGEYFGLHYSRVSRIIAANRPKAKGKT